MSYQNHEKLIYALDVLRKGEKPSGKIKMTKMKMTTNKISWSGR